MFLMIFFLKRQKNPFRIFHAFIYFDKVSKIVKKKEKKKLSCFLFFVHNKQKQIVCNFKYILQMYYLSTLSLL